MSDATRTLIELETKFWQSMVDRDADAAIEMLCEPAMMVSAHGSMKFDHAGYRRMAEQGPRVLTSFELGDVDVVFPNDRTAIVSYRVRQSTAPRDQAQGKGEVQEMNDTSTWVRAGDRWLCAIHTETPAAPKTATH